MIGYLCGSTIAAILGKKPVTNDIRFCVQSFKSPQITVL